MMTFGELAGMLAAMAFMWVAIPWEPDLSRASVFLAFISVACIGFAAVALVEMTIDAVRDWRRTWKNR